MKRLEVLLLFVLLLLPSIWAQTWSKTSGFGFQDCAIEEKGSRIWAVGTNGTIWFSDDKGVKWTKTDANGFMRIDADAALHLVFAVGSNGTLWYSPDVGKTWEKTNAIGIADVAIADNEVVYAVGADGSIWISAPGVFSKWRKTNSSGFQSIAGNSKYIVAAGSNGTIWVAPYDPSGDLDWVKTPAMDFRQVSFSPDSVIWATGNNGTVWFSKDLGKKWIKTNAEGMAAVDYGSDTILGVAIDGTVWIAQ